MRQNTFAAGAPHWTSLGSLKRSPRPLAGFPGWRKRRGEGGGRDGERGTGERGTCRRGEKSDPSKNPGYGAARMHELEAMKNCNPQCWFEVKGHQTSQSLGKKYASKILGS